MNRIMNKLTDKELQYFIDTVYDLIKEDNNKLGDLLTLAKIKKAIGNYKSLSEQDKTEMKNILKTIAVTVWKNR